MSLNHVSPSQYYNKKKTAENFFKGFRYDRRSATQTLDPEP